MIFYELPSLVKGDEILLRDRNGTKHTYSVSEKFVVPPNETWPIQLVENRDIVTLQTCTGPDYSQRLIVRADRS
jgi:sortase A